jgi:prophage regulatory protein
LSVAVAPRVSFHEGERCLSLRDVEFVTALKKSTIYAKMRLGEFPKSIRLTDRRRAWLSSEIQTWIANRVAREVVQERAV